MKSISVDAYDLPERVSTYDADMDIMHPLRHRMIDTALTVLPFDEEKSITVLDLGVGTGVFSKRVLEAYPNAELIALDGAPAMIDLARSRLGDRAARISWVVCDFQRIPSEILERDAYDLVISSYALHHLTLDEKCTLLTAVVQAMKPDGWLFNADLVIAASPDVEARIQEIRVAGVTGRTPEGDRRFHNAAATRQFLDEIEAADNDQPQTLDTDLAVIREAGINAEVLWKEFREAVIGGPKQDVKK